MECRAGGAVEEMGTFADGGMSDLAPIRAGERLALRATVHVPPDALSGGAEQSVHVALAYRFAAAGGDPGGASGAQMDAARALTLVVRLSGEAGPVPPAPPVDDASALPPADDPPSEVPPVTPLDADAGTGTGGATRVIVVQEAPLPTWFLAGLLLVLGSLVAVGGVVAYALLGLLRARQPLVATLHRGPVQVPPGAHTAAPTEGRQRGP